FARYIGDLKDLRNSGNGSLGRDPTSIFNNALDSSIYIPGTDNYSTAELMFEANNVLIFKWRLRSRSNTFPRLIICEDGGVDTASRAVEQVCCIEHGGDRAELIDLHNPLSLGSCELWSKETVEEIALISERALR